MGYQEFYVNSNGANLNGGSGTSTPTATYAGGTFVRSTGVFTVASGNPLNDGVAVGQFASIYTTAGATVATFIGRITARDATTITVSLTAISGATSAVSESAGAATCKVGGAWSGPSGAVTFPFGFITAAAVDASGNIPRINFTNTFSPTAVLSTGAGPMVFDGGDNRATLNFGTTNGALLTIGANVKAANLIVIQTATSGTGTGIITSGANSCAVGCVVTGTRGIGYYVTGDNSNVVECEAYDCNKSNTNGYAGYYMYGFCSVAIRCIAHDNAGSNNVGFISPGSYGNTFIQCIAESNGSDGFNIKNASVLKNCDAYNNGGDGLEVVNTASQLYVIENCNFVKNGGYGINGSGSGDRTGMMLNCGFGSGTQANTSGTTTGLKNIAETGSVTYAANATPYVDPANGDFRINLSAAKAAGRGAFSQTATNYAGTVGYPDIGAAQSRGGGAPRIKRMRV